MGLLKCKHKEYRIIRCDKNDKYYCVQCIKCGEQWNEMKAKGEEYQIGLTIKRG